MSKVVSSQPLCVTKKNTAKKKEEEEETIKRNINYTAGKPIFTLWNLYWPYSLAPCTSNGRVKRSFDVYLKLKFPSRRRY